MIRYAPAPVAAPQPSCRATQVARMADHMREMAFAGETVSEDTLVQRGWPRPIVRRLLPEAVAPARRLSVRQVAQAEARPQ